MYCSFGAGAELAAMLAEEAFDALRAPVRRIATPDVPLPYSEPLETELVVSADRIVEAARALAAYRPEPSVLSVAIASQRSISTDSSS